MAALFIDLDGTIFHFGTNVLLDGAGKTLRSLAHAGNTLIFTTLRPHADDDLRAILKSLIGQPPTILCNIPSPRIVINDDGAGAINHPSGQPWNPPAMLKLINTLSEGR